MFLSSEKIRERCSADESKLISEATFEASNVRQASYDMRLGPASYVVGDDAPVQLTGDKNGT